MNRHMMTTHSVSLDKYLEERDLDSLAQTPEEMAATKTILNLKCPCGTCKVAGHPPRDLLTFHVHSKKEDKAYARIAWLLGRVADQLAGFEQCSRCELAVRSDRMESHQDRCAFKSLNMDDQEEDDGVIYIGEEIKREMQPLEESVSPAQSGQEDYSTSSSSNDHDMLEMNTELDIKDVNKIKEEEAGEASENQSEAEESLMCEVDIDQMDTDSEVSNNNNGDLKLCRYVCPKCEAFDFASLSLLGRHIDLMHDGDAEVFAGVKAARKEVMTKCKICDLEVVSDSIELGYHVWTAHDIPLQAYLRIRM